MINNLKKKFGNKCSGININGEIPGITFPEKQLKLCESIKYSFEVPLRIENGNLGCPGARRSVGFDHDERSLAVRIAENNNIPITFIEKSLQKIPAYRSGIRNINFGITEELENYFKPDVYVMYVYPSRITEIMHLLAKNNLFVHIPGISFLSICGNIFAKACLKNEISISFGCPESRKFGGLEKDEVVIGVPADFAGILIA